jgi:hypothetical protein
LSNFTFAQQTVISTLVVEPSVKSFTRSNVYRFRKLIKQSPIRKVIGAENTQRYLAQLKPLTGSDDSPLTHQQQKWLTCQHLWWTNDEQQTVCDIDDLAVWQTTDRASFRSLIRMPWVQNAIAVLRTFENTDASLLSACVDVQQPPSNAAIVLPVCPYESSKPLQQSTHETASKQAAWMFTRAQQREKSRRDQERHDWYANRFRARAAHRQRDHETDWLFERQHHRHSERVKNNNRKMNKSAGDHLKSAWRRMEKMY